jgi:hypothetical protein
VRYLRHAKNMTAVEIHHELCAAVYGQNVMNEGRVRQWCRMFKDEEQSGWPAVVSERSCSKCGPKNL